MSDLKATPLIRTGNYRDVKPNASSAVSAPSLLLTALVCVALIFGGGGRPAPLAGLFVQVFALATCLAWLWLPLASLRNRIPTKSSLAVAGLILIVPILHLVPLPPAIWQSLPGREIEREILTIVNARDSWRPLSMAPSRTIAGLLSLVPPLIVLLLASTLSGREWWLPISGVAAVAFVSAILGGLQVATPDSKLLHFYGSSNESWVLGFQANRNAQVDVLLIGMTAIAALLLSLRSRSRDSREAHQDRVTLVFGVAIIGMLALAAVMTGSRAGIALLLLVGIAIAVILRSERLSRAALVALSAGVVALAGILVWLTTGAQGGLSRVAGRFQGLHDFRSELWIDSWLAIEQHWPIGGGMGTFQPLMIAAERLEVVDRTLPVRAHNDYLELALEAGLPGLIAWAVAGFIVLWALVRKIRTPDSVNAPIVTFSTITITVIALHSVVDYPLRAISLASLMGLASGLALAAPRPFDYFPRRMKRGSSCPS